MSTDMQERSVYTGFWRLMWSCEMGPGAFELTSTAGSPWPARATFASEELAREAARDVQAWLTKCHYGLGWSQKPHMWEGVSGDVRASIEIAPITMYVWGRA